MRKLMNFKAQKQKPVSLKKSSKISIAHVIIQVAE